MPFQPGAPKTAAEAAANYVSGATAKATKWRDRVLKPKRLFTDAGIAASAEWMAGINRAGTAGFEAGLRRVNLTEVAANIERSGATNYSTGITNHAPKYLRAAVGLIPAIQGIAARLPPRGDINQNIERAAQQMRDAAALRGQFRG